MKFLLDSWQNFQIFLLNNINVVFLVEEVIFFMKKNEQETSSIPSKKLFSKMHSCFTLKTFIWSSFWS